MELYMKKIFLPFVTLSALILAGCATTSTKSPANKYQHGFTIPKEKIYSRIQDNGDDDYIFEGKHYKIYFADEFDTVSYKNWLPYCTYRAEGLTEAKPGSGWLGSKINGDPDFEKIVLEPINDNIAMNKKVLYAKDGILHFKQVTEKKGKEWHVFLPGLHLRQNVPYGSIVQIRYKMPLKGKNSVYHFNLDEPDTVKWIPNEQGLDFQQIFLNETLSGGEGIKYNASMWFGKATDKYEPSWIDGAVADFDLQDLNKITFNIPQNLNDDNSKIYPMTEEEFYKWHTATAVYDEERIAIYHDDLLVYEWKWADYPECGTPLKYDNGKLIYGGERELLLEMGLSGDWVNNFELDAVGKAEADLWVGKIDMEAKEYDMQYDYVRIFVPQKIDANGNIIKDTNWYKDGQKNGTYVIYENKINGGLNYTGNSKISISKNRVEETPISFDQLNSFEGMELIFDDVFNLSELVKNNCKLQMDVRTEETNLEIATGFLNSRDKTKVEWRNDYLISNKDVPADGKWHTVTIPLSKLDGNWLYDDILQRSFSPEESQFDWRYVYKFIINNGPNNLSHHTEINNIRIIK